MITHMSRLFNQINVTRNGQAGSDVTKTNPNTNQIIYIHDWEHMKLEQA